MSWRHKPEWLELLAPETCHQSGNEISSWVLKETNIQTLAWAKCGDTLRKADCRVLSSVMIFAPSTYSELRQLAGTLCSSKEASRKSKWWSPCDTQSSFTFVFLLLSNLLKTPDKYLNQDSKRRSDWPGCELNEVQKKRILCDFQYYTLFYYTASPLCLRRKHSAEKRISHLSLDWPWALVKLNSHSIPPQNCQTLNHTLSLLVFTKFEEWYGIVVLYKLKLQAALKTCPSSKKNNIIYPTSHFFWSQHLD